MSARERLREHDADKYGLMAFRAAVQAETDQIAETAWRALDEATREAYRRAGAEVAVHVDDLWRSKRGVYGW